MGGKGACGDHRLSEEINFSTEVLIFNVWTPIFSGVVREDQTQGVERK